MTTKSAECECPLGQETAAAGIAGVICHHSSLQRILEAKAALQPICDRILRSVDLATLFTMPPKDGIEYYIERIAKEHAKALNIYQRAILTANFFRDYAILIQYAEVKTLEDLKRSGAV